MEQRAEVTLADLLLLLFIGLKLAGKITWSWWWVFSPLWGSFALFVLAVAADTFREWLKDRRKQY